MERGTTLHRFCAHLVSVLLGIVLLPTSSGQRVGILIDTTTQQRSLTFDQIAYRSHLTTTDLEKELGKSYRVEEYKKKYFKDPRHGKRFGHDAYVLVVYDSIGIAFKGPNKKELHEVYWYHEPRDTILAELARATSWMQGKGDAHAQKMVVNLFAELNETTGRQIPERPLCLELVINGQEVTDATFQAVDVLEPEIRVPMDTMFGLAAWETILLGLRFSCAYPDPLSMRRDRWDASYGRFLFFTLDKLTRELRRAEFLFAPTDH